MKNLTRSYIPGARREVEQHILRVSYTSVVASSGVGAMNPFKVTIRNTNIDVERYRDINVIRIVIVVDELRI